mmetsp:Transcript_125927/g.251279  ORF Transcript_125927/g.251279 Transcript_125927/m.251279 type:complete len:145 (+) Transcript_125927:41-475(+)
MGSPPADTERGPGTPLSKPRDNEIYHRFHYFLRGGPRIVIPDAGSKSPAPNQHCRAVPCADNQSHKTTDKNGIKDVLPGSLVELRGLQAKPELNGKSGTVIGFDPMAARYQVRLACGESKLIKPWNLKLLDVAVQHWADQQQHQ